MARKRYKPEESVSLLRQAEVLHGQGKSMADAIHPHGRLGYRPPAPEAIVPPRWPPGSATLRRSPSLAEKPSMH